jgi:hypothetical protein
VTSLAFLRYISSTWLTVIKCSNANRSQAKELSMRVQQMISQGVVRAPEGDFTLYSLLFTVSTMFEVSIWLCSVKHNAATYQGWNTSKSESKIMLARSHNERMQQRYEVWSEQQRNPVNPEQMVSNTPRHKKTKRVRVEKGFGSSSGV